MDSSDTIMIADSTDGGNVVSQPDETISQQQHGAAIVLIAEDEEPIAETLALIIADAGYTVLMATHGRQALELARTHRPSLIITDLMMPYIDGATLIAELRNDSLTSGTKPIPIVLMTAAGKSRTFGIDADAILPKPFDVEEVEALLSRFLNPSHVHAQ